MTLVIPDREQINQLSKSEVNKIFLQHKKKWKNKKTNTSDTDSAKDEIKPANITTALKSNDIIMSRNQKIIAKNKAIMAKIETMLNEIETQIPDEQTNITNAIASNSSARQQLPVILIFLIVLVIIFSLILHFIKKRVQVKSIKVLPAFGLEEKYHAIKKDASEPIELVKKNSHLIKIEINFSNVVNSTNTRKFQDEQQPIKKYFQRQNTIGTLEKVFQCDSFVSNKEKIYPEKVKRINPAPAAEIRKKIKPESTVKPVRVVLEKIGNPKVNTFYQATQSENLTYELLAQEIDTINFNENIIFFIEEFERLSSKLTIQTSTLKTETSKIEKLIQFQLSIQTLIELSEIIQATQLCNFTQIVFEFLEEIIDGRIVISIKDIRRLSSVIDFYYRYFNSVKINQYYKLSASPGNL